MKRNILALVLMFLPLLLPAQDKPIITVLDFKTSGVSEREMKSIISLISNGLFRTGEYTVIDVLERETLLREAEISLSDCVDESCQLEIGKQLSAELIVVGSIDKVGSSLILASKMLETQSARTVGVADGVYGDLDELVRDIGNFAGQLAGTRHTAREPERRSGVATTSVTSARGLAPVELVLVEAGSFIMGSEDGAENERPLHWMTISRSFYMSTYEVTQKQWQEVMGTNPSHFNGSNLPAENMSWYEAVEYCNRLSWKEGLKPCFLKTGTSVTCDFSANGYRLPTEAEWEYAARGGNKSRNYTYAGGNSIEDVAWYFRNAEGTTHPVGQKRPNELGLYDLSGNVFEFCWDQYGSYDSSSYTNPQGPSSDRYRVLRGGSWDSGMRGDLQYLRVSGRCSGGTSGRAVMVGFRIVRTAE